MLVIKLEPKSFGRKLLRKHPKYRMLLPLRNLLNKINGFETNIGLLREDFFITSLFNYISEIRYIVSYNEKPDFFLRDYIFEIGGKTKTKKQIQNYKNSFIIQTL